MKKKERKLSLNRETVRTLEATKLNQARGGFDTDSCVINCLINDEYDTTMVG